MPYNDPGFWSDTRSVELGDIDVDGDIDILFANSGWLDGRPDELSNGLKYATIHQWTPEHHGQIPQLLLNMGGDQHGVVPKGAGYMVLGDFLDVGYYALPYGRSAHMTDLNPDGFATRDPNGGARVGSDFELTHAPARRGRSLGRRPTRRPRDRVQRRLDLGPAPDPDPDGMPDLLVVRGANSLSTVLINSGNWDMVQNASTGQWYTKGRFFRGDIQLNSNWDSAGNELKNMWEVQPWDANGDTVNDRGPFTDRYSRFEFWEAHNMYSADGRLGRPRQRRPARRGARQHRDESRPDQRRLPVPRHALRLPLEGAERRGRVDALRRRGLAYGVDTGDVDADGDVDIVVAGVPSALALRNLGGAQGGTEGFFEEHTFQDNGGGWLPMTGHAPLYAPLLTETVVLFDADDSTPELEMIFSGYPAYDSLGNQYHFVNEAEHWHFYDQGYHNPIAPATSPTTSTPVLPHCTFYTGVDSAGVYKDLSLATDAATGKQWLDRNGRVLENKPSPAPTRAPSPPPSIPPTAAPRTVPTTALPTAASAAASFGVVPVACTAYWRHDASSN